MEITGHIYENFAGEGKPRDEAWWQSACLACVKALSSIPKTTKKEGREVWRGGRGEGGREGLKYSHIRLSTIGSTHLRKCLGYSAPIEGY